MILLTGFEPFGGDAHNPSERVVAAFQGATIAGVTLKTAILPVDSVRAETQLERLVTLDVHAVVMLGLARGRTQVALERVALNVADDRLPDNVGRQRHNETLHPGGADAHLSSLPLEDILRAWREANLPGYVSNSAGLYLCNQVFYAVRHRHPALMAGFVHLPSDETLAATGVEPFVPPRVADQECARDTRGRRSAFDRWQREARRELMRR
ncbi:MAG: pyrrolidone-carboxylate peptidase [Pleurocapsa sp. SU_196_0]|nr:pyrrolidone-carboxylate peptidase [Pleurocapsa sp. SU_196_0]